jgi:hypothetical protein
VLHPARDHARLEHGPDGGRRHVDVEVELVRHRLVERQVCGVTGIQPAHLLLAGGGVLVDRPTLHLEEPNPQGHPGGSAVEEQLGP